MIFIHKRPVRVACSVTFRIAARRQPWSHRRTHNLVSVQLGAMMKVQFDLAKLLGFRAAVSGVGMAGKLGLKGGNKLGTKGGNKAGAKGGGDRPTVLA